MGAKIFPSINPFSWNALFVESYAHVVGQITLMCWTYHQHTLLVPFDVVPPAASELTKNIDYNIYIYMYIFIDLFIYTTDPSYIVSFKTFNHHSSLSSKFLVFLRLTKASWKRASKCWSSWSIPWLRRWFGTSPESLGPWLRNPRTMERSTIFKGKIHYFYGHFQ